MYIASLLQRVEKHTNPACNKRLSNVLSSAQKHTVLGVYYKVL